MTRPEHTNIIRLFSGSRGYTDHHPALPDNDPPFSWACCALAILCTSVLVWGIVIAGVAAVGVG